MDGAGRSPGGMTMAVFLAAVVLGGGNFIAVRFSNTELAPFWGAGLRFGLAALLFTALSTALRLPWPRGLQLWQTMLYGVLAFALFYALMYWALVRVTAGVATIVLAIVPLVTVLLAAAHGLERLGARSAVGAVLAMGGIVWMVLGPQPVDIGLPALAAMLLAALTVGESIIVSKRLSAQHAAMTNAVGMATGAVLLLVLSAFVGDPWVLPRSTEALWAVMYLVTLGSVGLFLLVLEVVKRWTASATSYLFVLFPVATLALGALLAGEPVTAQAVIGAAVVMAGVWFGALSPGARRVASPPPVAPTPAASAN